MMARIKHNRDTAAKTNLKGVKNGSVAKNKNPKYKYTPTGKVALIKNNPQNNKDKLKKNVQNDPNKKPQKFEALNVNSQKKGGNKQSNVVEKKKSKQNLQDSIENKENSFDETIETPDIFGTSLADETDSDDNEFVGNEEEEEDNDSLDEEDDDDTDESESEDEVYKGVKMFKGIKSVNKLNNLKQDDEDLLLGLDSIEVEENEDDTEDSDNDDVDDDEEEEESEDDEEVEASMGDSSAVPDESDEVENEDEDDIDDSEEMSPGEDEEESDEEPEYEDEANGTSLGLKALLGNSLMDDDDDEDFEGLDEDDEDEEISDDAEEDEEDEKQKTIKLKKQETLKSKDKKEKTKTNETEKGKKILTPEEEELKKKRTIFIGNVPRDVNEKQLKKVFAEFGPIENMRIRGIMPPNPGMNKRVAAQTKQMHIRMKSLIVFITYKSEESAQKALIMNGKKFEGHYLRVDTAVKSKEKNYNQKKAVFLGNLSLTIDDNSVWEHFNKCGEIESVTIVRDRNTRIGKGFGYVNFKTEDAVALALELDGSELKNRTIRVKRYAPGKTEPKVEAKKRSLSAESKHGSSKKFKKVSGDALSIQSNKGKHQETSAKSFQGQKAQEKKSKKSQKMGKKQKIMAAKFGKNK